MFLADMFDAKVVDELKKLDGTPLVAPEAWCCGGFIIVGFLKTGVQEVVC